VDAVRIVYVLPEKVAVSARRNLRLDPRYAERKNSQPLENPGEIGTHAVPDDAADLSQVPQHACAAGGSPHRPRHGIPRNDPSGLEIPGMTQGVAEQ